MLGDFYRLQVGGSKLGQRLAWCSEPGLGRVENVKELETLRSPEV
jgi:hypothetical protein